MAAADTGVEDAASKQSQKQALMYFYGGAVVALSLVALFFLNAPKASGTACDGITPWWVLMNAKKDGTVEKIYLCAKGYKEEHHTFLMVGFVLLYTALQSFAIPSSIILSFLSGALYEFPIALVLVLISASSGAAGCYTMSKFVGGSLLSALGLTKHLANFKKEIEAKQKEGGLLPYMVMARVCPVPNTLINASSPHLGVPFVTFVVGTFFGLIPLSCVHIMSGRALATVGKLEKGPVTYILAAGAVAMGGYYLYDKKKKKAKAAEEKAE
eukprot:TRINITY_DN112347_c0_g1_i1.p1 TRINITY_DN112347_c0_g1~~TRINITY_DN112347_c0_g1_i1.p1  ORF type:complete len:270 (-),score=83.81 TRINITY_DN112347_c0_g1_i1:156-965(-)